MLWLIAGWGRSWQTKGKTQWGIVVHCTVHGECLFIAGLLLRN